MIRHAPQKLEPSATNLLVVSMCAPEDAAADVASSLVSVVDQFVEQDGFRIPATVRHCPLLNQMSQAIH